MADVDGLDSELVTYEGASRIESDSLTRARGLCCGRKEKTQHRR